EKVTIEVTKQEPFMRKVKTDGKEKDIPLMGFILTVSSGSKVMQEHVAVMEDGVYRLAAAGKQIQPPLCFAKAVKAGESWKAEGSSEGASLKGTFISGRAKVTVPMGEFITDVALSQDFQIGDDRMEVEYWLAKDIGM